MPVDARCKLVYLSGIAKKGHVSFPRAVFGHLWSDDPTPANPTELARVLGVGQSTLQACYTKMPAAREEQLAMRYGFTIELRQSWRDDPCPRFKEHFEAHWK